MGKPLSFEDFKSKIKHQHIQVNKSDYKGLLKPMVGICPYHGHIHVNCARLFIRTGCSACNNAAKRFKTFEKKACGELVYIKETYTSWTGTITAICPKHGQFIGSIQEFVRRGRRGVKGCDECILDDKFQALIENIASEDITLERTDFKGMTKPMKSYCKRCNRETNKMAYLYKQGRDYGCPKCANTSQGEKWVMDALDAMGLKYRHQVRLTEKDGVYGRRITVDFLIESFNLVIEYNGKQHYKEDLGGYYRGADRFMGQLERDRAVRKACADKGLRLVEIPYSIKHRIRGLISVLVSSYMV